MALGWTGHLLYLALLFGWALPVIGLHWLVGAPELKAHRWVLLLGVLVPTAYLVLADTVAIGSGVWEISRTYTIGVRVGGLVLEEVIFFVLTNVMVAQSIILFLSPSARRRAWERGRSLLRRGDETSAPHMTDAITSSRDADAV